jgi:hypothetical protein
MFMKMACYSDGFSEVFADEGQITVCYAHSRKDCQLFQLRVHTETSFRLSPKAQQHLVAGVGDEAAAAAGVLNNGDYFQAEHDGH